MPHETRENYRYNLKVEFLIHYPIRILYLGDQPKAIRYAFSARTLSQALSVDNEVDNDVYISSSLETQNGTSYINILSYSRFILGTGEN
jgi:hypothetical protein